MQKENKKGNKQEFGNNSDAINEKHPMENVERNTNAESDNMTENIKYLKKLELRRTVLNKLVGTSQNQSSKISDFECK